MNALALERIIAFASGLVASTALVWGARQIALRLSVVSYPNPLVETHKKPVPYLGGAAIFLVLGVLLLIFEGFKTWVMLLVGTTWLLCILGTIDDIRPLRWWLKLVLEFLIVSVSLPLTISSAGLPLNIPGIITGVVVIVVLTNGFNLIDVSDGVASGAGGLISLGLTVAFIFYSSRIFLSLAPLILLAALIGFLIFNWPPARIYMGDGGSLPLGFVLGTLIFFWTYEGTFQLERLVAGISLSSLVLFELTLICFHRLRKGQSIFQSSPDHFALRLAHKGWNSQKVLLATLGVSAFLVLSLALMWLPRFFTWIYIGVLLSFYITSFVWLSRVKVKG